MNNHDEYLKHLKSLGFKEQDAFIYAKQTIQSVEDREIDDGLLRQAISRIWLSEL